MIVRLFCNRIYISIHPFSLPAYPCGVVGKGLPISSGHWARGRVHPGQVAGLAQGDAEKDRRNNHVHPNMQPLSCRRNPEYLERILSHTEITCKLHAERT
ncbi:hypothetical protein XENORESO_017513 [Xenotaenia resolanae]|uniref:Uncharacterized protein n=1 Tax=Xenotaenia resolanae TaxID=208358 RepID=A0ABV0WZV5_9TELE